MANAIAAVAENRMTMYAAVKQYKIPSNYNHTHTYKSPYLQAHIVSQAAVSLLRKRLGKLLSNL